MADYYVNDTAQESSGDHEVHKSDCYWLSLTRYKTYLGCVSKVVEIGFGASPSGLSFAAVRPLGQGVSSAIS